MWSRFFFSLRLFLSRHYLQKFPTWQRDILRDPYSTASKSREDLIPLRSCETTNVTFSKIRVANTRRIGERESGKKKRKKKDALKNFWLPFPEFFFRRLLSPQQRDICLVKSSLIITSDNNRATHVPSTMMHSTYVYTWHAIPAAPFIIARWYPSSWTASDKQFAGERRRTTRKKETMGKTTRACPSCENWFVENHLSLPYFSKHKSNGKARDVFLAVEKLGKSQSAQAWFFVASNGAHVLKQEIQCDMIL